MAIPYTYVDAGRSTAAAGRSVAGTSLTVAAGDGAKFGSPSTGAPMRLAVWRSGAFVTTLQVTGVSGDVLTIAGAMDGHSDAAILAGDDVAMSATKGDFEGLWTSIGDNTADIATNTTAIASKADASALTAKADDSAVVHLTGDETIAGTKTFSSPIAGDVTGSAASVTGPIPQSQVTGLASALAAKADDSSVVHVTGAESIAGVKTFTSTLVADINGTAAGLSAPLAVASGGTGLTTLGTAGQVPTVNTAGTALEYQTPSGGAGGGSLEKTFLLSFGQDMTTATTTRGAIVTKAGTIAVLEIQANVNGSTGGFSIDLLKGGVSIFSAPVAVAANTTTVQSVTSFAVTSVAAGDTIIPVITAVGAGVQDVVAVLRIDL